MWKFRLTTESESIFSPVPSPCDSHPSTAVEQLPQQQLGAEHISSISSQPSALSLCHLPVKCCHILVIILKEKKNYKDKVMLEHRKQSVATLMSSGSSFPFPLSTLPRKCIKNHRMVPWAFQSFHKKSQLSLWPSWRDQACDSLFFLSCLRSHSLKKPQCLFFGFLIRCLQWALSSFSFSC